MPSDAHGAEHSTCCLFIERIEGLKGTFSCKASLPNGLCYNTEATKDGNWNQSFTIQYNGKMEDILFQIHERGWLGEYVIGSYVLQLESLSRSSLTIERMLHLTVRNAPVILHVRITNSPVKERPAIHMKGRKRSFSSTDDEDMVGYFESKLAVHKAMIDELGSFDHLKDGADSGMEVITSTVQQLEESITQFQNSGAYDTYKKHLDNITPSKDANIEKETNFWNVLVDLPNLLQRITDNHAKPDTNEQSHHTSVAPPILQKPMPDMLVLEEKLQLLQKELSMERNHVGLLQKRNSELEVEIQRKTVELSELKEKDANRDKVVWERLELFDEKFKKIEAEREILNECEKKLHVRELELQKREAEIQKNIQDMRVQKDGILKSIRDNKDPSAYLPLLENMLQSNSIEHHLSNISTQLAKLDQLDDVMNRIQQTIASGGMRGGGGGGGGETKSKRSMADIKADIEKLQPIIMDEKSDTKEREAANIKIDRLFVELASTDEYKAEMKRAQEEKARINEPLNQEALKIMLQKYKELGDNDEGLQARKRQYVALTLIGMERDQIIGKHQNDFNQYLLGDLTMDEVRAIRASLPVFRRDQKRQLEFVEAVDLKIEQMAKNPSKPPPKAKKVFPLARSVSAGTGAGKASPASPGMGMANLAAELMAKRRKVVQQDAE